MKTGPAGRRKPGFTLVELTVAMVLGMAVAGMSLILFNQQLAFLRIFRTQDFLVSEAPLINGQVTMMLGSADGLRLYTDAGTYGAGDAPVFADADLLVLRFLEPDGSFSASALSFESPGEGQPEGLYHRRVNDDGSLAEPGWYVSLQPADVDFRLNAGIVQVTITGPNGERITYSGTEQL